MNITNEVILILIGCTVLLSAVVVFSVFAYLSFAQSRKDREDAAFKQVNNLYKKIKGFQTEHPKVSSLSGKWQPDIIHRVYNQSSEKDKQWAKYYTFVELCIGYCNTVLHARKRKLIDKNSYINQHEPFIKQLLRKHRLIIDDMVRKEKYISDYIKDFRQNLIENKSWNRRTEHEEMVRTA
ncbi:MAG: hypothetical protein KAW12_03215 [Candidatus Aminicenantes bacterium]|nr:hypothetical protein [Candidatus Aminicenantes bacterium]